jgi:GT2 family glycosyltransferase
VPQLSIITATFNNLEITQAYWNSLVRHPPPEPWEIIWIDDCSTDGTCEWLKSIGSDNCRVILNTKNQGFAANNNLGARLARGDRLVFLNNDLILTENWLHPLLNKLEANPKIGIIGNVQLEVASGKIDHAGVWFDLAGCPAHSHKGQAVEQIHGKGVYCEAVTAACWLVKKAIFISCGGFDEQYINGAEDIDLCLRLYKQGYQHFVSYESVIYHHVHSSPGRKLKDIQNQALFLQKWGEFTSELGERDWPREYLKRILKHPTQINATKTLDALLRFVHLKSGSSNWATRRREKLIGDA